MSAIPSQDYEQCLSSLAKLKAVFFSYDLVTDWLNQIRLFFHMAQYSDHANLMYAVGETGCGKSALAREFEREVGTSPTFAASNLPVIRVETPASSSTKALATEMLRALGDPCAEKGVRYNLTDRVLTLLKAQGVKLVILDDFQHLICRDNKKVVYDTADWFKTVVDQAGCTFLLLGMPDLDRVIAENAQLGRRVGLRVQLQPFSANTASERQRFLKMLALFAHELPFGGTEILVSDKVAWRLHSACKGLLGLLVPILQAAGRNLLAGGGRDLKLEHLAAGVDALNLTRPELSGKCNPFRPARQQALAS